MATSALPQSAPPPTPATLSSLAAEITHHSSFLRFSHLQPLLASFEATLRASSKGSTRSSSTFEWEPAWSGPAGENWSWGHWIAAYCNPKHVKEAQVHLALPLLEHLLRLFPRICRSPDRWGYTMVHWACQVSECSVRPRLASLVTNTVLVRGEGGA